MSATGLPVFDRTLQDTNTWLRRIHQLINDAATDADVAEHERQRAYDALCAVLVTLRDRIPADLAAHLGAQLPPLVRGVYYEGYDPSRQPETYRAQGEFFRRVEGVVDRAPLDGRRATEAVLTVLSEHVTAGLNDKARDALPEDVREVWPMVQEENA